MGLTPAPAEALAPGSDAAENAAITTRLLEGQPGPRREIVLLNAAAALVAAGVASSLRDGVALAAESIDSGRAMERLERLRRLSHDA